MKIIVSIILCMLCCACFGVESQVIVSTWELKQQVRQLRQDISIQQGGTIQLLDRCAQMLRENPRHLVAQGSRFLNIQDALLSDLKKQGLLKAWIDHVAVQAKREQQQAQNQTDKLLAIALTYPATQAAEESWQNLADIAWDHGHLGSYVYYAHRCNEQNDKDRRNRLQAAEHILAQRPSRNVPTHLERVDPIWEEQLPVIQKRNLKTRSINNNVIINSTHQRQQTPTHYQTSEGNTDILALSNGTNMLILDPLLGRRLGPIHHLGNKQFGAQSKQPFVHKDIIVAIGGHHGNNAIQVLACDRLGQQIWRKSINNSNHVQHASQPIILDNKIFISLVDNVNSSERIELIAIDLQGKLLWRKIIAQVGGMRSRSYRRNPQDLSPDICIHRGHIALLSNRGLIAQVSSDGNIISLDTYPVRQRDMQFIRDLNNGSNLSMRRSGRIMSDGSLLIAAPIDSPNILIQDQGQIHIYNNDGKNASILDFNNGRCLLADEKFRLLNCQTREIIWEHERQSPLNNNNNKNNQAWGRVGEEHSIFADNQQIKTIDNNNGNQINSGSYPNNFRVCMHSDLMLFIGERLVTGRGDGQAFEKNLLAAAKTSPLDYQPRIALAALRRAQGKSQEAFDYLLTAIDLGAPRSYSENAAQILRPHLYLTLNTDQFDNYLNQLKRLLNIDAEFDQELTWWRARRAEHENDISTALALYQSMKRPKPRYITLSNRLTANLNTIAETSILRLKNKSIPWAQTSTAEKSTSYKPWQVEGSSPIRPLSTGHHVISFNNGFLRCYDARSGKEIWKQNPEQALPMLGVSTSSHQQGNARVVVLKGMTAESIGMKHNDVITKFNEHSVNTFADLIKGVATTGCGEAFKITVQRGEATHTFEGVLGSKPMQATQANKNSVLCRNVFIRTDSQRPGHFTANPDVGNTPFVEIYDVKTGALLWHHDLINKAVMPVLTSNDLLLESIDGNLVARDIRDEKHSIRWTAKGQGHELDEFHLQGNVLVSIERNTSMAHIRNINTGALLYSLPCNPLYEHKLIDDQFICTLPDGHLALWQLSTGDMLWTSQELLLKPIAASANAIYCTTSRQELISLDRTNGTLHRKYPQWSQVFANEHNDSTLFIACVSKVPENSIAAIHLKSGNVVWQHPFSPELQFDNVIHPHHNGAFFRLSSDDDREGFVNLLNDGSIHSFIPLANDDQHAVLGNQLVISGDKGLRISQAQKDKTQAVIKAKRTQVDYDNYTAFIKKHMSQLSWQSIADNEFAILHNKDQFHILCRFKDDNQRMRMRLGFGGPLFDNNSALVLVKSMFPIALHIQAGWQLSEQTEFTGTDEKKIRAFSLQAPPLRSPATPILLHVDQWQSLSDDIWWMRKHWYRIESK